MSELHKALPESIFRAPIDGSFSLQLANSHHEIGGNSKKKYKDKLQASTDSLDDLQRKLYAQDRISVLCVFQAIDAAGKDSTIRNVFGALNPAGCQVFSFKSPSKEELDHDFLWRSARCLPERGRIGVFNRSYYEEVLVVKVHPEYLARQRLDGPDQNPDFWAHRYQSIRDHETHLVRNGTLVLKFWLNVSKEEQRQRFLARIEEQEKNWKFSAADIAERGHWDAYMQAYEECIRETSTELAPWYVIPADNKPYMRFCVAQIIEQTMQGLGLAYPKLKKSDKRALAEYANQLRSELE